VDDAEQESRISSEAHKNVIFGEPGCLSGRTSQASESREEESKSSF